jgi:hypothetical protein
MFYTSLVSALDLGYVLRDLYQTVFISYALLLTHRSAGDARAFWMDVRSPSGQLIRSVRGTAAGTGPQYTFTLPLEPKIDLLGSLVQLLLV